MMRLSCDSKELGIQSNKYNELLSSFSNVCKLMEAEGNKSKKLVNEEIELTINENKISSNELSECLTSLNETCNKIMLNNMYLKTKNFLMHAEHIEIPNEIQLDTVTCLKEIYHPTPKEDNQTNELLKESYLESISSVTKIIENNINELEDFQSLYSLE